MLDLILSLFTGGNGLLVGLAGILGIITAVFFKGRSAGAKSVKDRIAADRLKARTEADKIDDAIAGRTADTNRERLKKWARD